MRISVSKLKQFKACRKSYEFKYIEGLNPVKKSEALEVGESYHKKLESLYNGEDVNFDDYSKESAMAVAYKMYIYPKLSVTTTEDWLEMDLGAHTLVGRVDAIADDRTLVEHKSTSLDIDEFEYNLQWDEQPLAYMLLADVRKIYYTVCRKPNIRLKKYETQEQFFRRMVEWYGDDTHNKIRLIEITRSNEEVEGFRKELIAMTNEMDSCNNFYRNTLHCFRFGRPCEYESICLSYDQNQEYVEFSRREEERNEPAEIG